MNGFDDEQYNKSIGEAEDAASRRRKMSFIAEALSDIATAGSRARGAEPTDTRFYESLRAGTGGVDAARAKKQEAIKNYLISKKSERQDMLDTRQSERDALGDERWEKDYELRKAKGDIAESKSQFRQGLPYTIKLDPFGRPMVLDKRSGQISYGKQAQRIMVDNNIPDEETKVAPRAAPSVQLQTPVPPPKVDYPLQPRAGEGTKEFGYRLKQKYKPEEKYKPTEHEAATFAQRIDQAEGVFEDLGKRGYSRADITSGMEDYFVPAVLSSDENLEQNQAERNFINAVLRRESGASIADSEFESAELQYFPRVGDSERLIKQKAENRRIVADGLKREARGAYTTNPSEPSAPDEQKTSGTEKPKPSWAK